MAAARAQGAPRPAYAEPTGILASGFNIQMNRREQKFNLLLKDILRDGIVTDQEWDELEVLRKELDLNKEEAEMLILLSEARKQQRQIDWISSKIEGAEQSGFTTNTKAQILAESKAMLNG